MQIIFVQSGTLEAKMLFAVNIMSLDIVYLPKCCKFAQFVRSRAVCLRVYGFMS